VYAFNVLLHADDALQVGPSVTFQSFFPLFGCNPSLLVCIRSLPQVGVGSKVLGVLFVLFLLRKMSSSMECLLLHGRKGNKVKAALSCYHCHVMSFPPNCPDQLGFQEFTELRELD
jgi:hypothetical protein